MSPPFTRDQLRALAELSTVAFPNVPIVVVGAAAINCFYPNPRGTLDLDISVAVARETLDSGFARLVGWRRHPGKEHEWYGPGSVRVDVLPASPELIARGQIAWPSGHTMSLVGFEHVFSRYDVFEADGQRIHVARPEVLALLKIVAYLDRPAEREHDLEDLLFLTEEFVPPDDERRWSAEIVERQVPYEEVGAYILGRAMAAFVGPRDREAIASFFNRVDDRSDATLSRMLKVAPPSCRSSEDSVLARVDALRAGLGL